MTTEILVTSDSINWEALANLYRDAKTDEERRLAFVAISECVAVGLPDDADEEAGAWEFLRNRGLA
jgi:hypothetical protein